MRVGSQELGLSVHTQEVAKMCAELKVTRPSDAFMALFPHGMYGKAIAAMIWAQVLLGSVWLVLIYFAYR